MNQGWYRVKGSTSPLGYRYYGPPAFNAGGLSTTNCSGDQVYLVPWYTGPGGFIDQLVCYFNATASVAAHMGIYAANHVRFITPGGLFFQTSVEAGVLTTTASVNFLAAANALMWLAIQLPEARGFNTLQLGATIGTLGWETTSLAQGYWGLVCSYAYASGLPPSLSIAGVNRTGPTNPPPFIGVHYV